MLCAGEAVDAVVFALRLVIVTDKQMAKAKKQLLADVYMLMEDPLVMVENICAAATVWRSPPAYPPLMFRPWLIMVGSELAMVERKKPQK